MMQRKPFACCPSTESLGWGFCESVLMVVMEMAWWPWRQREVRGGCPRGPHRGPHAHLDTSPWAPESLPGHIMLPLHKGLLTSAGGGVTFTEKETEASRGQWSQELGVCVFQKQRALLQACPLLMEASPVTTALLVGGPTWKHLQGGGSGRSHFGARWARVGTHQCCPLK